MSQATLPVMEHFYTIQGEGAFSGQAAYFIRLGGCDVGCVWCDVKESWDETLHPRYTIQEIIKWPLEAKAGLVVITGGEPLMHPLDELCHELHKAGMKVNIETSGAHPFSGSFDWLCLSPKKFKQPLPEIYALARELKIIVYNSSDFKWAEEQASLVNSDCRLFLQVEWDRRDRMTSELVDFVKANPRWTISVQTHKYMNIP